MTQDKINELREEFANSEVCKRLTATENFAINHGFQEWKKPTVFDFWLSKIETLLKERDEITKKEIVEKIIINMPKKSNESDIYNRGWNGYAAVAEDYLRNLLTPQYNLERETVLNLLSNLSPNKENKNNE